MYFFFKKVNTTNGDKMNNKKYKKIVDKHKPKEKRIQNSIIAFISGGIVGIIAQALTELYSYWFDISTKDASTFMLVTIIFFACLFTALGFFDKWVTFCKCGLIIPITGFAHSMTSAALEYKHEGLVLGIGANIFKLAGTVILYGIVSVYFFGLIRLLIMGG